MSGLLERIAQSEQFRFVIRNTTISMPIGTPALVNPAGRQIDGSQVWAAMSVLVGNARTGQRPLRSSSRVGGNTWLGGKRIDTSRFSAMIPTTARWKASLAASFR